MLLFCPLPWTCPFSVFFFFFQQFIQGLPKVRPGRYVSLCGAPPDIFFSFFNPLPVFLICRHIEIPGRISFFEPPSYFFPPPPPATPFKCVCGFLAPFLHPPIFLSFQISFSPPRALNFPVRGPFHDLSKRGPAFLN